MYLFYLLVLFLKFFGVAMVTIGSFAWMWLYSVNQEDKIDKINYELENKDFSMKLFKFYHRRINAISIAILGFCFNNLFDYSFFELIELLKA
tara:strand:- start:1596 stop:1871 length:276 start_codon:yes stop_codon:yes gene_type:complete